MCIFDNTGVEDRGPFNSWCVDQEYFEGRFIPKLTSCPSTPIRLSGNAVSVDVTFSYDSSVSSVITMVHRKSVKDRLDLTSRMYNNTPGLYKTERVEIRQSYNAIDIREHEGIVEVSAKAQDSGTLVKSTMSVSKTGKCYMLLMSTFLYFSLIFEEKPCLVYKKDN